MGLGFVAKPMGQIDVTGAGVYYFKPIQISVQEKMGFEVELIDADGFAGSFSIDFKATASASWCPFQISGSTYTHALTAASGIITGSVGKLTFTSISPTTSGSELMIVLEDGATAGAETVTVAYDAVNDVRTITVGIDSGTSTAAQVIDAIEGDTEADALVSVAETISGKVESAFVELTGSATFVDVESAAQWVRIKLTVTAGTALANLYFGAKS